MDDLMIKKTQFIVVFLEKPTLTFYEYLENNWTIPMKWADLANNLCTIFKPIAQKHYVT